MWTGADDETPDGPRAVPLPFLAAMRDDDPPPREPSARQVRARRATHHAMQPTWDAICRSLSAEQRRQRTARCVRAGC